MIETTNDSCPHCGRHINDLWEFFVYKEQDEPARFDCPYCDQPISGHFMKQIIYVLRTETK